MTQDGTHVGKFPAKKGCASVFRHFEHKADVYLRYFEMQ